MVAVHPRCESFLPHSLRTDSMASSQEVFQDVHGGVPGSTTEQEALGRFLGGSGEALGRLLGGPGEQRGGTSGSGTDRTLEPKTCQKYRER